MASRVLTVALRAVVGQYQASMLGAAKATTPLEASLLRVARAGTGVAAIGTTMTRRLTVPLVAAGVIALKMSSDFETAMTKVSALTLSSADDVDRMRDSVLRLAGQTGVAPKELAEALFVVASNGLRGAAALSVLEASAKASAAGLGDTATIARAVGSVIQTYGIDVISAAEATDILAATAKAGNFPIEQLAGSLGRILPTAKDAGVGFADVGGAIALFTRTSGDANRAITDLDSLLRGLVRPTQQSRQMLADMGITTDDLRESMGEKGLVATLRDLDVSLEANNLSMDQYLRRAEGQRAANIILSASNAELAESFGITHDALGTVDVAFSEIAETVGFKATQSFANLQVALIRLGDAIAPLAGKFLGFAGDVAAGVAALPGPITGLVVALGGLLALSGPLLKFGGQWVAMLARMGVAVSASLPLLGILVTMVGVVTATIAAHGQRSRETAEAVEEYARAVELQNEGLADAVEIQVAARTETGLLGDLAKRAGADVDVLTEAIENDNGAIEELIDNLQRSGGSWEQFNRLQDESSAGAQQLAEDIGIVDQRSLTLADTKRELLLAMRNEVDILAEGRAAAAEHAAAVDEMTAAEQRVQEVFDETGELISIATGALLEYQDALRGTFDPTFAAMDATQKYADSIEDLNEKQAVLDMVQQDTTASTEDLAKAQRDVDDAAKDALKAYVDQELKLGDLALAYERGEVSIDQVNAVLDQFAKTGGPAAAAEADKLRMEILGTTEQAQELTEQPWVVEVGETGNRLVQQELSSTQRAVFGIPERRHTNVSERGAAAVAESARRVKAELAAIPSIKTIHLRLTGAGAVGGELSAARRALGRQHGGPVFPGRAFLVGEQGPELAFFGQRGQIVPHGQSMSMLAGMRPAAAVGGGVNFNISFTGSAVVRSGRMLDQEIMQSLRHGNLQMVAVDSDTGKRHRVRAG